MRREFDQIQRLDGDPARTDAVLLGLRDGLAFRRGAYDLARRLSAPVRGLLLAFNRRLFPLR